MALTNVRRHLWWLWGSCSLGHSFQSLRQEYVWVPNQNWPDIALDSGSCFGPGTKTRIFHFHGCPTLPYNCGASWTRVACTPTRYGKKRFQPLVYVFTTKWNLSKDPAAASRLGHACYMVDRILEIFSVASNCFSSATKSQHQKAFLWNGKLWNLKSFPTQTEVKTAELEIGLFPRFSYSGTTQA